MFEHENQYPNDVNFGSDSPRQIPSDHFNDYSHYYGEPQEQKTEQSTATVPGATDASPERVVLDGHPKADYTNAGSEYRIPNYQSTSYSNAGSQYTNHENANDQPAYHGSAYQHAEVHSSYPNAPYAHADAPMPDKKRKRTNKGWGKKVLRLAGSGVIFGAVAGLVMVGILYLSPVQLKNTETEIELTGVQKAEQIEQSRMVDTGSKTAVVTNVTAVVDEVMPSVVSITGLYKVEEYDPFGGYFGFGVPQEREQEGSGSGIIVGKNEKELLIATNYHVVADATSLSVQFIDGETVEAQIKGTESDVDLAVIAVSLESIKDETSEIPVRSRWVNLRSRSEMRLDTGSP